TVNDITTQNVAVSVPAQSCLATGVGSMDTTVSPPETKTLSGGTPECLNPCEGAPLRYRLSLRGASLFGALVSAGTAPDAVGTIFGESGTVSCEMKWLIRDYAVETDISTGASRRGKAKGVQVDTLIIDGTNYPLHQFRKAEPDMCESQHWHSYYGDFEAWELLDIVLGNYPTISEPESERTKCGFGTADALATGTQSVPYSGWKNYAKKRCESDAACGLFTD
ncbi:MAG: hypothetical protein KC416_02200, partial [Myxococcales bacterium]|nr:hypothetical protein [Myxococcales bacterium]